MTTVDPIYRSLQVRPDWVMTITPLHMIVSSRRGAVDDAQAANMAEVTSRAA